MEFLFLNCIFRKIQQLVTEAVSLKGQLCILSSLKRYALVVVRSFKVLV